MRIRPFMGIYLLTVLFIGCGSTAGGGGGLYFPDASFDGTPSWRTGDALGAEDAAQTDAAQSDATSVIDSGTAEDIGAADAIVNPTDTTACTPNCGGAVCGDDGCGGQCGTCAVGTACIQSGLCRALAPTDLCKTVSCDPNAYCTMVDGAAACECKLRYEGNGKSCKDLDECKVDNGGCDANAFCTNQVGAAPLCSCMDGYSGNGAKCLDSDECKLGTANCGSHATCANTPGSYDCVCDPGFSKIGSTCVDLNECATAKSPCDPHATCTNNDGGFSCTCNPGYKGNGFTCNQDTDCGGSCDSNASCKPMSGQAPACVCNIGFSGTGTKCVPVPSTVTLHTINLSPFDTDDNKTWDGGVLPESDRLKFEDMVKAAAEAYTTGNYMALLPAVTNLMGFLSAVTSPPDPLGTASLASQNQTMGSYQLSEKSNTLNPFWANVTWSNVVVDASTTLTIDLYDADVLYNDAIGKASVSGADLLNALKFGAVLPIDVSKQGKHCIVFVQVQVTPAYVCGNGQCDSAAGESSGNCPLDCGGGTSGGGGHFCDANCDGGNGASGPQACYCDAECKKVGDCCDAKGAGPAGMSCAGSTCGSCK